MVEAMDQEVFVITEKEAGQRLDVFCVAQLSAYSRGAIQRAVKDGAITVNGQLAKPRTMLREGDSVAVKGNAFTGEQQQSATVVIPTLPILHEDKDIVVIDKPAGIAVHPGQGQPTGTVADWFSARYPGIEAGEPGRYGIVHRLDKETSGVLLLAKHQEAMDHFKAQFKNHRARKEYLALVLGKPGESKGRITRPLARSKRNPLRRTVDPEGKSAVTEWQKEESFDGYTLLRIYPLTGRTHQIRVHLHFLGFPIVGDKLYVFKRKRLPEGVHRHLLHAEKLTITNLKGKKKTFVSPLPSDFTAVLESLST